MIDAKKEKDAKTREKPLEINEWDDAGEESNDKIKMEIDASSDSKASSWNFAAKQHLTSLFLS